MKIGIISCGKKKKQGVHKAKDIYIGNYFKSCLKYSLKHFDKTFILSAKYGLLELDTIVFYYEKSLNSMNKKEKIIWSKNVAKKIKEKINSNDILYFVCGKNYYKFLSRFLTNDKKYPLPSKGMGYQIKYLKENT